jgi:SPP1 family predicted phage head-tail adaptor
MRAGNLDREISIERIHNAVGSAGVPLPTWTTICSLRAELIEASTDEYIRNAGASTERVVVFRTRFYPNVTPADRVKYRGEVFDIKQVKEIGREHGLDIRAVRNGA